MGRNRNQARSNRTPATQILAERRVIQERMAALNRGSPVRERGRDGGDNTPRADLMEEVQATIAKEQELATRAILMARLEELAQAEEKIRGGTYGRCDSCGHPIPLPRLRAMPAAVHCVPCAEREGSTGHYRRRASADADDIGYRRYEGPGPEGNWPAQRTTG